MALLQGFVAPTVGGVAVASALRRAVAVAVAGAIVDDGGAPPALRAAAVYALAADGGDDARVLGCLRDPSEEVALEALRVWREDSPGAELAAALGHASPVVRAEAAQRLSPERDRGALAARLRDESDAGVREVIEARLRGA